MENFKLKYFLGANSCEGFCSFFDKCYIPDGEWRVYIIKGGPGTGKSSFMKYFAAKASDRGYKTVLCPCSSDPDSLDAVILPDRKIAVMDGTAPHTVDPAFPGACEKILDFGSFWDDEAFKNSEINIIETTLLNKALHKTASRYMQAAGQLMADSYKTALACTDRLKTVKFARGLCRKLIPESSGAGNEWVRFIQGITPLGVVSYAGTVSAEADKTVVIALKNPFLPSLITDHIIIPQLSLAFVTENEYMRFPEGIRRIHARRFVPSSQLHLSRERMKFNRKAVKQLLLSAAETLSRAKKTHDDLERHYIKAMDFDALTAFAVKFTDDVLG